ncbi:hypothetical protein OEA41_002728 [Lepraria neglecta]|uniref:Uncharacterized protein n=1 Tax=Lepraria neglecta TaxID=209136 RepID=A0AAD9Z6E4_9LECA|nr:hypothetical protein OEA41_002728 [Lepraria neglecta]
MNMAFLQASPLLILPLELRTKIFEELLCPHPGRIYTLYNDRQGREASFNIDPTILRVNKQIYSESVSLLYNSNVFEINLTTPVVFQWSGGNYPDRIPDPPPLFRNDDGSVFRGTTRGGGRVKQSPARKERLNAPEEAMNQEGIYPYCFQRLRHIRLLTSRDAVWGDTGGGYFFSHTGELIMRMLSELSREESTSVPKALEFVIFPEWLTRTEIFKAGKAVALKAREIAPLLRSVEQSRTLLLGEALCSEQSDDDFGSLDWDDYEKLETKKVDIEELVANLGKHSRSYVNEYI